MTVADGNVVHAIRQGKVDLNFEDDQGRDTVVTLSNVYYIPGLNRRLFSIPAFTANGIFTVHISKNYTQLDFGDGCTFTWPLLRHKRTCHAILDATVSTAPMQEQTMPAQAETAPAPAAKDAETAQPERKVRMKPSNVDLVRSKFSTGPIETDLACD